MTCEEMTMSRHTGTVRWYSAKGFGFIDSPGVEDAFYFHITAVKDRRILQVGEQVSFEPTTSPKGLRAIAVETKETNNERYQSQLQTS